MISFIVFVIILVVYTLVQNSKKQEIIDSLPEAIRAGNITRVQLAIDNGIDVNRKIQGETSLFWAAQYNQPKIIFLLLGHNAFINEKGFRGITPLMVASINGSVDSVKALLEEKADMSIIDENGTNALMLAAMNGYLEIVKLLVNKGADLDATNSAGETPLLLAGKYKRTDIIDFLRGKKASLISDKTTLKLIQVCEQGDIDQLKAFIQTGIDINTKYKQVGKTALMAAAEHGHQDLVEVLVSAGAVINDTESIFRSPCELAIMHGHVNIGKFLLQHGAATPIFNADDLGSVCEHGYTESVRFILEQGIDANEKEEQGQTALMRAANKEVAELLLQHGASILVVDDNGNTVLMHHCRWGRGDVVNVLLGIDSTNVNAVNNEGQTALEMIFENDYLTNIDTIALLFRYGALLPQEKLDEYFLMAVRKAYFHDNALRIIEILLKAGANVNCKDKFGDTALSLASNLKVTQLLVKYGVDTNTSNDINQTVLMSWCSPKQATRITDNDEEVAIIKLLLEAKADINAKDNFGNTALLIASLNKDSSILTILLEAGADINVVDNDGNTALIRASVEGLAQNVKRLIEYKSNIDIANNRGETALMLASQHGNLEIVEILLKAGANASITNCQGMTALNLATQAENTTIVDLLQLYTKSNY